MAERLATSQTWVEALESDLENTKASMKTEVENLKKEHVAQETTLTAVTTRLAASEAEVTNLQKDTAAQSADLKSVAERLAATETDMEYVKEDTTTQHTDLTTMKTEVMSLTKEHEATTSELFDLKTAHKEELEAVTTRLAATETEVENLEKEIKVAPKVAFSAGLTDSGSIVAGNTDLNLVFTKTITNVGQAYSSTTGFFTAPVRGVYYFRFTVMDLMASHYMNIRMRKNGHELMVLYEYDTDGKNTYLSSGLTLQLEEGDVMNLAIQAGYSLYDNGDNHSTFSGFLIFPL
ncbi:heavy metal-binding protein HIP-like [Engraulis encrasicolus]|uniref:heavy metal-binding protein HIP-like n=1 Tax=Engraulis encrasicolus TaxID=184585 RepID=UPI002FD244D0